eukprot:3392293-Rhodomonas_salina.2
MHRSVVGASGGEGEQLLRARIHLRVRFPLLCTAQTEHTHAHTRAHTCKDFEDVEWLWKALVEGEGVGAGVQKVEG